MNFWGTPPSTDGGAPTDHRPHPGPKGWERAGFGGAVLSFWGTPRYWGSIDSLFGYQGLPIPPQDYGGPLSSPLLWGATSQGYNTSLGFWGSPQYYWSPSAPPWVLGGSHTHSQHYWFPSAPPPGFGVLPSTTGPHQSSLGFWGSPMPPPDHYRSLSVPLDFGVSPMSPQHYGSPSVPS